jgi:hypothetical protein
MYTGKLLSMKKPKWFVLPIHPLNNTPFSIIQKTYYLTCLLPFIYTDWTGASDIKNKKTSDINKGS